MNPITLAIVGGVRAAGHPFGRAWTPPAHALRCCPMVWDLHSGGGSRSPYPEDATPAGVLFETGEEIPARPAHGPDPAYGACLAMANERRHLRVLVYAHDGATELSWLAPDSDGLVPHLELVALASRDAGSAPEVLLWVPPFRAQVADEDVPPAAVYAQVSRLLILRTLEALPTVRRIWIADEPGEGLQAKTIRAATQLLLDAGDLPLTVLHGWDEGDLVQLGEWFASEVLHWLNSEGAP